MKFHANKPARLTAAIALAISITHYVGFYSLPAAAREPQSDATQPQRWPGFLGAGATPLAENSLPLTWSTEENIVWRTALPGQGQSSPVIWGTSVFVTSIKGPLKNDCHVVALDLESGKQLWNYSTPSAQPVRSNYFQSRSAPTPLADARQVYAFFETGKLLALTHEGKEVWTRNLVEDYGEFEVRIGLAASPLQTHDAIVVVVDHEGPSYLLAVDKSTGKTLWKTKRFSRQSYASPALVPVGDGQQIVISSSGSVDGYDPTSGKLLWTYEKVGGNRASTPLPYATGHFLVGASPGMNNERLGMAKESNFAMRIDETGGEFKPQVLWKTDRAMPSFGSPIVHAGCAYWLTSAGVLYCFEAETGKQHYVKRLGEPCWATPLATGSRIYFFGKNGTTKVIAAGPNFKELAENVLFEEDDALARLRNGRERSKPKTDEERAKTRQQMEERGLKFADKVQYGYAAVNGHLVIKTGTMLYCIADQSNTKAGAK